MLSSNMFSVIFLLEFTLFSITYYKNNETIFMHPLIVHLIKIMYFLNIVFYYSHLNIKILIQICNSINNNINIYNVYYVYYNVVYYSIL